MPYYLTKVLPLLIMPVPVALLLGLLALILILRGRRKPAIGIMLAAISLLWVSSCRQWLQALWTCRSSTPSSWNPYPRATASAGGCAGDAEYPSRG
jgi:hypothetical protein